VLIYWQKIFLLKFAKPDNKKQLIVDSGFRCHLTSFSRATAAAPSDFVARLRKYLKTRRVTAVSQIGTDRIIEFTFSDGQYRLFLEFYAGGNIILTDKDLNIIALLRIVAEGEGQEELRVGLKYSLEDRQNYRGIPPLTKERLRGALQKAVEKGNGDLAAGKKIKNKGNDALRKALAVSITEYPPMLVDHAMRVTNFDASLKPADVLGDDALLDHLLRSLQESQRVIEEITSLGTAKGYIIAKQGKGEVQAADTDGKPLHRNLMYDDFHPFKPRQFEEDPACTFLEYEGFNRTVDEFFSSIEGQKLESRLQEREETAKRKLEAARQDQAKRLGGLQEAQELNIRKAGAIEANVERVQEAMDAVNGLIGQGMDWVEIGKLIELEQKRSNPVAGIIRLPLKLEENTVTLLLDEEEFAEDEESADETDSDVSDSDDDIVSKRPPPKKSVDSRLVVEINLGESPWSNAREYYEQRRSAVVKEQKTLQSSSKALKSTEQKIAQDLKKGLKQEKAILRPVRRQIWFEKFTWFISSDGYLVLGGRDAQQNEILYKKYLRKGDVGTIVVPVLCEG
jgi:predicted ribosome quality control (RQC) complex YloA/Tae2 family protein